MLTTRVSAAVDRALDERQRCSTEEVERILAAAVRVMERVAPEPPRVSDIVAEAGSSNKAFYRYFAGKDDLVLAVMERGIAIVISRLQPEIDQESTPAAKVARWIEGLFAQMADPHLLSMCSATVEQLTAITNRQAADEEIMAPLRALLSEPVAAMGRPDPVRDADAVFYCTIGTLRRYIGSGRRPPAEDIDHLVRFCLQGLGAAPGAS
ncbi:TetR/AcrR family transcriptional regulator [Mycobacterium sp. MYCO198283]|uniref:TetR/AcrR family transcriptional regulator n=1 Tax=Mycobacterium sp. MYCO198283 TaxID=2883505 RepID=UPI001E5ED152|nr:TetR/AcrR family transcriptional regulator [Mycobacterium sp. MYCO198283]MCG5434251.1 TetR/AcrR family transcriptional regulator [Mycobacterium sp. MYCO198283]